MRTAIFLITYFLSSFVLAQNNTIRPDVVETLEPKNHNYIKNPSASKNLNGASANGTAVLTRDTTSGYKVDGQASFKCTSSNASTSDYCKFSTNTILDPDKDGTCEFSFMYKGDGTKFSYLLTSAGGFPDNSYSSQGLALTNATGWTEFWSIGTCYSTVAPELKIYQLVAGSSLTLNIARVYYGRSRSIDKDAGLLVGLSTNLSGFSSILSNTALPYTVPVRDTNSGFQTTYIKSGASSPAPNGLVRLADGEFIKWGISPQLSLTASAGVLRVAGINIADNTGGLFTSASRFYDTTDPTKLWGFDLSNITTATQRTWTIGDRNINFQTGFVNADIAAAAGIVDTKLATISTAGKVSNSATTATSANTASTIVSRDGSNNFSAGTVTAAVTGTASGNTTYTPNNHGMVVSSATNAMTVVAPDASTSKVWTSNGLSADPGWQNAASSPQQSYEISNVGISASVSASALTIALKQSDGSTNCSSGASACNIGFRNATAATGSFSQVQVTGALSTVISSGSTAGQTSAVASTLYVYAINNAGTAELSWSSSYYDCGSVVTTTAEGGAGAADSGVTMYSTTARTGVACRLLSRMLNTQSTAGTWASTMTEIALGPFTPPTGSQGTETYFTGSGTFTTPANSSVRTVYHFTMTGGGGGGGHTTTGYLGTGGGGSGGSAVGTFTGIAPSTAITITVGAGGSGSTGTSGGSTTIGLASNAPTVTGGAPGSTDNYANGAGGTLSAGSGYLSIPGGIGGYGQSVVNPTNAQTGGAGGNGIYGGGGYGGTNQTGSGAGGTSYGAGGGGGYLTSASGGNGFAGVVVITQMTP